MRYISNDRKGGNNKKYKFLTDGIISDDTFICN